MRVTYISATRILSDRNYGNYQATAHAELEPGDDIEEAFDRLQAEVDNAANRKRDAAREKIVPTPQGANGERKLVRYPIR